MELYLTGIPWLAQYSSVFTKHAKENEATVDSCFDRFGSHQYGIAN